MESSLNRIKISLILNYIIVFFTIISLIIAFANIKIMFGNEPVLESSTFGIFRFFTVDSNLLIGISALVFSIEERKLLLGKINNISTKFYIFKYASTVAVSLTFIVVFTYLARISAGGIMSMLMNSNLFFHLIIPVLSMLTFILFEKTDKIKFKHVFYGLIPMLLYAVYYIGNLIVHVENGKVLPKYDWYWFVQGGIKQAFVVAPGIIMITFVISIVLWFLNKKSKRLEL